MTQFEEKEEQSKETRSKKRCTDRPGEALVLGDVCDAERLHGVFYILCVHVVNLTDITVPEETETHTS